MYPLIQDLTLPLTEFLILFVSRPMLCLETKPVNPNHTIRHYLRVVSLKLNLPNDCFESETVEGPEAAAMTVQTMH